MLTAIAGMHICINSQYISIYPAYERRAYQVVQRGTRGPFGEGALHHLIGAPFIGWLSEFATSLTTIR